MKPDVNAKRDHQSELTRRAFLRKLGASVTAVLAAQMMAGARRPALASEAVEQDTPAMLIDLTRCVGCNSCALACKESNGLPSDGTAPRGLDSDTFSFVSVLQVEDASGESLTRYVKRQCMHCLDPACVAACPAAAMYRTPEGPVLYRAERCLGCRYCQSACPFGVPMFEWDNPITAKISKCWFCYERQQAGDQPACAAACPSGAIRFGQRSEILAYAHAKIASAPDRYVDHVFGEHEVGGTSVLYLSDIPFAELGFPASLPDFAPPEQTEKVMNALPTVIVGVGALAAGTAAYTHRRSAGNGKGHAHDDDSPAQEE